MGADAIRSRERTPALVVVFTGLPGTGKSTLAESTARERGCPAFATDWLLGSLKPAHRALAELDRAAYLATSVSLLRGLIHRQLLLGQSSVIDSVVGDDALADWQSLAAEHSAGFAVVECVCSDEAVHRARIDGRVRGIPGWHEIDWAHVERMRAELASLAIERLVVDAVGPLVANEAAVSDHLDRAVGRMGPAAS